jgi:predicted transcriptional regulator
MSESIELTDLQLDILRVLWKEGGATTAEVHRALQPRALAFTTVSTLLTRMEKKGVLERVGERPYTFRARVSEREVRRSMMGGMMDRLFGGDLAAAVSHLLGSPAVSADDLKRMQQLISEKRREMEGKNDG